jgi:hypothetical protein
MKLLVALLVTLWSLIACPVVSGGPVVPAETVHVIDFEGLPAMPLEPPAVPDVARLSDQFIHLGILFRSAEEFVAVAALGEGQATSGVNGIVGVVPKEETELRPDPELDFQQSIIITFIDPQNPSQPGKTDFFSVRADRIPFIGDPISDTIIAFDAAGNEIASATRADIGGQTWTLSAPGMSQVVLPGRSPLGGNPPIGWGLAYDDVRFATVRAVPLPPALVPGLVLLVGIVAARARRGLRS